MKNHLVVLVPAYNESSSIGDTIQALMVQERKADQVIVIPNGCTDDTADIARRYPVTVMELPKLEHLKSEALNRAWLEYAQDATYVVCLDADTVLPSNALKDWEIELQADPALSGVSSKFTMQKPGILTRVQKAEFATWTASGLRLGKTSVLAGTGCIFNNKALLEVAHINSLDPTEEIWKHLALSGNVLGTKTVTGKQPRMENTGEHIDLLGSKPMEKSLKDLLFGTSAITRRASIWNILNLVHPKTTRKTASNENDITSYVRNSVNAGKNSITSTAMGTGRIEPVMSGEHKNHKQEGHQNSARRIENTTANTCENTEPSKHLSNEKRTTQRRASNKPKRVQESAKNVGPWSYNSAVEDFRLTYRTRQLGYYCHISPTVRAYTDSMRDLKSLWAQRMKWSVGTQQDLLTFGVNRLTLRDWGQQLMGLLNIFLKSLWLAVIVGYGVMGELTIIWGWLLLPFLFIGLDVKRAMMIPHRDKKDIWLAVSFFPNELFMWMRAGWTAWSWIQVFKAKITKNNTDLWAKQAVSEGIA